MLDGIEVAEFAESLIYDDRSDICFAYDLRDEGKRRL